MNGILIVNKPKNISSNKVLQIIKTTFNINKIGHSGTLDPLASGILIICIGKATKLSKTLSIKNKEYIVESIMGIKSESNDIEKKTKLFNRKANNNNIKIEIKKIPTIQTQSSPTYSAIKHKGCPLYKYARIGIKIKKPERSYQTIKINLIKMYKKKLILKILCTKGTYIREIINDLSKKTLTPLCVSMITRTAIGKFNLLHSYSLQYILKLKNKNNLNKILIK